MGYLYEKGAFSIWGHLPAGAPREQLLETRGALRRELEKPDKL